MDGGGSDDDAVRNESPDGNAGCRKSNCSTAMVLYEPPVTYDRCIQWLGPDLMVGIDLKIPPNNWMRGRSPLEKHIQQTLQSKCSFMPSIGMAMDNVHLIDEVDVVSDSKNIKNLLQTCLDNGKPISLMIHRVGKTILIDDFDIHKHLLRQQSDDWEWMKDFFHSLVENKQVERYPRAPKTHKELMDRNMFSKFLYYSILSEEGNPLVSRHRTESETERINQDLEEMLESGDQSRTLQWNFERLKMLIGTDLPIFNEDSTRVSLRLQDENDPITVLTGLEYWLDNLMCNVPEIAMCYHMSGFIQRYEQLSTAEIPEWPGATFSPTTVMDMAQNILSFLKSNATKVGHTYWLYKEKDGDIIKLYDLTSLCDSSVDQQQSPFRLPLANLLYRVALNIHKKHCMKKSGLISSLLTNSLILLNGEQPQITAAAKKILCELYLSDNEEEADDSNSTTTSEDEDDFTTIDEDGDDDDDDDASPSTREVLECQQLNVKKLTVQPEPDSKNLTRLPPISGCLDTKCVAAIHHVAEGLQAIDRDFDENYDPPDQPMTAISTEAIPMPYEPILKKQMNSEGNIDGLSLPSVQVKQQRLSKLLSSWHGQSKCSLLLMSVNAYYKLADSANLLMDYGAVLKYLKMALISFDCLKFLIPPSESPPDEGLRIYSHMMKLSGDVQLKLAGKDKIEGYQSAYNNVNEDDQSILDSCYKDISCPEFEWAFQLQLNVEERLLNSLKCYKECDFVLSKLGLNEEKYSIGRRLGNCCNELAMHYMNQAAVLFPTDCSKMTEEKCDDQEIEELLCASAPYLSEGISHFRDVSDRSNIALLLSNSGRLVRIRAQVLNSADRSEFTTQERHLYDQAAEKYLEALHVLSKRENSTQIWDLVTFELSGVYCTIASMLQDYAPLSTRPREEIERDVTDLMLKALKYCDSGGSQQKESLRQYRAATIHHRLASLFHNAYRTERTEQKAKHFKTMTESHYHKASDLFYKLSSFTELFRVELETVALYEFEISNMTSMNAKSRLLLSALAVLLGERTSTCLHSFNGQTENSAQDWQEVVKLMKIYPSRIQFVLLQLVKTAGDKKHRSHEKQQKYKEMYRISLTLNTPGETVDQAITTQAIHIHEQLNNEYSRS